MAIDLNGAEIVSEREFAIGRCLIARLDGRDRLVALRPLEFPEDEREESIACLRAQAKQLAGFEHPGCLRVHGLGERDGREMLVFDNPRGEDMRTVIHRGGLSPVRGARAARRMASILAAMSDAGHLHPDLQTASFFIDASAVNEASVELCPLALPKPRLVERKASPQGYFAGSPHHAAPELLRSGGANRTEASDIFAFGAIVYEMLAGRAPFEDDTTTGVLVAARDISPDPAGLPDEQCRICLRCLDKSPERRFPTFASVEAALRIAEERLPAERFRPDATGPRRGHAGTLRMGLAAVAIAMLAAVAGVFLATLGGREPSDTGNLASSVLAHAEALMDEGRGEDAALLLRAHPGLLTTEPAAYGSLLMRLDPENAPADKGAPDGSRLAED